MRWERRPGPSADNFQASAPQGLRQALDLIHDGIECEWCRDRRASIARPDKDGINLVCEGCATGETLEGSIEQQRRAFKRANPDYVTSW
jgi:hypothetical protein